MKYTGILLSVLLLAGCGGGGGGAPVAESAPVVVLPEVVSGCATKNVPNPWSGNDYTKTLGNYTASTNTWNKQSLLDWTTCIKSASLTTTGIKAVFDIEWPTTPGSDAVRSYTNVTYTPDAGFSNPHSWMGTKSLDPINIAQIGNATVHHDVEVNYSGYTQTFYSFAVDPSSTKFMDRAPLVEMGINLHPLSNSPQNLYDTIVVNGNTYWVEFWESSVNGQRLVSLAFVSQNRYFKGSIPLKPFFDYIITRNLLPSTYYLHSMQLGMEAFSGKGTFTVNEFNVTK